MHLRSGSFIPYSISLDGTIWSAGKWRIGRTPALRVPGPTHGGKLCIALSDDSDRHIIDIIDTYAECQAGQLQVTLHRNLSSPGRLFYMLCKLQKISRPRACDTRQAASDSCGMKPAETIKLSKAPHLLWRAPQNQEGAGALIQQATVMSPIFAYHAHLPKLFSQAKTTAHGGCAQAAPSLAFHFHPPGEHVPSKTAMP